MSMGMSVTVYRTRDGREFYDPRKYAAHEAALDDHDRRMGSLQCFMLLHLPIPRSGVYTGCIYLAAEGDLAAHRVNALAMILFGSALSFRQNGAQVIGAWESRTIPSAAFWEAVKKKPLIQVDGLGYRPTFGFLSDGSPLAGLPAPLPTRLLRPRERESMKARAEVKPYIVHECPPATDRPPP